MLLYILLLHYISEKNIDIIIKYSIYLTVIVSVRVVACIAVYHSALFWAVILHIVAYLPCSLVPSFLPLTSSTWEGNRKEKVHPGRS